MAARKTTTAKPKAAVKKVVAKKAKPKRKVATRKVAKKKVVAKSVVVPVTSVAPVTPVVPEANYKEVRHQPAAPQQRFKLWLTVGLSMAVIVCIWAYTLSQSLLNSSSLADSSKALELDTMVENIGGSLSTLKSQTDQFVQQTTNQNSNTNSNTNGGDQPTNQQLDNLFSDLQ